MEYKEEISQLRFEIAELKTECEKLRTEASGNISNSDLENEIEVLKKKLEKKLKAEDECRVEIYRLTAELEKTQAGDDLSADSDLVQRSPQVEVLREEITMLKANYEEEIENLKEKLQLQVEKTNDAMEKLEQQEHDFQERLRRIDMGRYEDSRNEEMQKVAEHFEEKIENMKLEHAEEKSALVEKYEGRIRLLEALDDDAHKKLESLMETENIKEEYDKLLKETRKKLDIAEEKLAKEEKFREEEIKSIKEEYEYMVESLKSDHAKDLEEINEKMIESARLSREEISRLKEEKEKDLSRFEREKKELQGGNLGDDVQKMKTQHARELEEMRSELENRREEEVSKLKEEFNESELTLKRVNEEMSNELKEVKKMCAQYGEEAKNLSEKHKAEIEKVKADCLEISQLKEETIREEMEYMNKELEAEVSNLQQSLNEARVEIDKFKKEEADRENKNAELKKEIQDEKRLCEELRMKVNEHEMRSVVDGSGSDSGQEIIQKHKAEIEKLVNEYENKIARERQEMEKDMKEAKDNYNKKIDELKQNNTFNDREKELSEEIEELKMKCERMDVMKEESMLMLETQFKQEVKELKENYEIKEREWQAKLEKVEGKEKDFENVSLEKEEAAKVKDSYDNNVKEMQAKLLDFEKKEEEYQKIVIEKDEAVNSRETCEKEMRELEMKLQSVEKERDEKLMNVVKENGADELRRNYEQKVEEMELKLKNLKIENEEKENVIRENKEARFKAEIDVEEARKCWKEEADSLKYDLQRAKKLNEERRKVVDDLQEEAKKRELTRRESSFEDISQLHIKHADKIEKTKTRYMDEIKKLQEEIEDLRSEKEKTEKEMLASRRKTSELEAAVEQMRMKKETRRKSTSMQDVIQREVVSQSEVMPDTFDDEKAFLIERNKELERELEKLKAINYEKIQTLRDELERERENAVHNKATLELRKENVENEQRDLEVKYKLEKERETLRNTLNEANNQADRLRLELEAVKDELVEVYKVTDGGEFKIKTLNQRVGAVVGARTKTLMQGSEGFSQTDKAKLQRDVRRLESELEDLSHKYSKKDKDVEYLKEQLEVSEQQKSLSFGGTAEGEKSMYELDLKKTKLMEKQIDRYDRDIERLSVELREAKVQNRFMQEQFGDRYEDRELLRKTEKERDALRNSVEKLQREISEKSSFGFEGETKERENLELDKARLENQVRETQRENIRTLAELESTTLSLRKAQDKYSKLKDKFVKLKERWDAKKEVEIKNTSADSLMQTDELEEDELMKSKQENQFLDLQVQRLYIEMEKLKQELSYQTYQAQQAKKASAVLMKQNHSLYTVSEEDKMLQEELKCLSEEKENLANNLTESNEERNKCNLRLTLLEEEKQKLREQNDMLFNEKANVEMILQKTEVELDKSVEELEFRKTLLNKFREEAAKRDALEDEKKDAARLLREQETQTENDSRKSPEELESEKIGRELEKQTYEDQITRLVSANVNLLLEKEHLVEQLHDKRGSLSPLGQDRPRSQSTPIGDHIPLIPGHYSQESVQTSRLTPRSPSPHGSSIHVPRLTLESSPDKGNMEEEVDNLTRALREKEQELDTARKEKKVVVEGLISERKELMSKIESLEAASTNKQSTPVTPVVRSPSFSQLFNQSINQSVNRLIN